MNENQRKGLLANLDMVKAQRRLAEGRTSGLSPDALYDLVLRATGDRTKAEAAAEARIRSQHEALIHGSIA